MEDISWWEALTNFERIYWGAAIPASMFLIILIIGTLFGGDTDDMGSADSEVGTDDGLGFQFFTLKNVIGFFTLFGWSGLACIDAGYSTGVTIAVSVFCGLIMMTIMASIFFALSRMTESGTLNLSNAIGAIGEVYLPIEKERGGFGKVQVHVQGQMRTLQALTDGDQDLVVGAVVEVLGVINENILLVKKQ